MITPGKRGDSAAGRAANQAEEVGTSDSTKRSFATRAVEPTKLPPPGQYLDRIDDTLNDSFPASDPPSWMGS